MRRIDPHRVRIQTSPTAKPRGLTEHCHRLLHHARCLRTAGVSSIHQFSERSAVLDGLLNGVAHQAKMPRRALTISMRTVCRQRDRGVRANFAKSSGTCPLSGECHAARLKTPGLMNDLDPVVNSRDHSRQSASRRSPAWSDSYCVEWTAGGA